MTSALIGPARGNTTGAVATLLTVPKPAPLIQWRAARDRAVPILATRIRYQRLKHGLTIRELAETMGASESAVNGWEQGVRMCHFWRIPEIAAAIGIPVAQLSTDDLVLAEIRVSPETLELVRQKGESAAQAAAERISAALVARMMAEAWAPPVRTERNARPKRRRARPAVLAALQETQAGAARNKALRSLAIS